MKPSLRRAGGPGDADGRLVRSAPVSGSDDRPLWVPAAERAAATNWAAFARAVGVEGSEALQAWALAEPEAFWASVWERCGLIGDRGDVVIAPGEHFWETRFFPEARLSVVENIAGERPGVDDDAEAVVALDETGARTALTRRQLRAEVAAMAAALREAGVGRGDRVAAWLPNGLESMVTMLGAASLGAVYSSTSPDFGEQGRARPLRPDRADRPRGGGLLLLQRHSASTAPSGWRPSLAGLPTVKATVVAGAAPAGTPCVGRLPGAAPRHRRSPRNGSRSTTRGTCSTRRARRASRSASSTGRAAC